VNLAWLLQRFSGDHRPHGARAGFSDAELVQLTMAIVAVNGWNRIAIALGADVGSYRPPTTAASEKSKVKATPTAAR
jgi:hypothetical protein